VLQRLRATRENDKGFTLVELLIVIVILGVLAGIVVFAVSGITDRGEVAACKADVKTVQVASEAYYAKNGGYAQNIGVTAGQTALVPDFLQAAPNQSAAKTDGKYRVIYDNATGAVTGKLNNGAVAPAVDPNC
jgi:general secretion pathway protein G